MNLSLLDKLYIDFAEKSWLFRKNTSRVVRVSAGGQELKVLIDKGIGFDNVYYYKEKLFPIVSLAVRYKKGAFIDIGANIGQMLVNVLIEEKSVRYVGFEPNLACCGYVERLIELNGLKDHVLIPIGLAEDFKIVDFLFNGSNDVCASTTPMFRPSNFFQYRKKVIVEKGDDVLARLHLDSIGVVKIDVEGGELEVVRGLMNTLKVHKPLLLVEVLPYMHLENDFSIFPDLSKDERMQIIEERKRRAWALEEALRELGYCWYRIEEDGNLIGRQYLRADGPQQKTEMNFMAVHGSEKMVFEKFVSNQFAGKIFS